jgi:hypothetical protein
MSEINSISINEVFWVRFESHSINLGFKGLPLHVHFTISFSPKSDDINFHITKNNGTENDKPKIEILRINKQILEEDAEKLSLKLLFRVLEEIPFSEIDSAYFLPIGDNNSDTSKLVENKMHEKFKDSMEMKGKKKLKMTGDLENKFKEFATDADLIKKL